MTRKQELSVLQSIGMTKRQLNRMVQCEAGLIAAWNIIITFLAGGFLGFMLIRGLNSIGMSYLHWAYPIGFALFLCGYCSYHASNYNKGDNLSPSEKVYCGEIAGNRIKRLKYSRNTVAGHSRCLP